MSRHLLTRLAALAALSAAPAAISAQVSGTIHIGPPQRSWGHEVVVQPYAQDRYGDWQRNYRKWSPVTVYYVDGHYYPRQVRGARAVVVYRRGSEYFLPPRDDAWVNHDKRYNYRHRPTDEDYNHPPRP